MQAQKQQTQQKEVQSFRLVEDLQSAGINVSDIKKLQEAGLNTIGSVLQCSSRDLIAIKGLTEARVEKIKEAAKKLDVRGAAFKTGLEMKEKRKNIIAITTGATALDKILGGGIESSSITELFGEFRTGKTQLAHTLCVTSQLSFDMNGGQGKVIYLDTEGNFRPERIEAIAERFGLDAEQTLDNIIICRVYSHEEQMEIIKPIAALLSDIDQGPFRLLIIDSIIALFRVEFSGRGELSERQQKLGQHLSQLVRIAEEFNIAVVVINQCMADPGALSMFGPVVKPVGGHVLAHASTTRVMLKKGKGEQRIGKIFDSPLMPEEDATFQITNGGIDDIA
jgi:meiotic recombination protein DMC1